MRREVRIRLLVVIGSLEVGGAETHLARVLPRLRVHGIDIRVHTIAGRGALADPIERAGVKVIAPNPARRPGARTSLPGRAARLARAAASLLTTYATWRPDIVHFFLPGAYLVGAPLAIATSRAKRVMSRRSLNDYQAKRPALARIERRLHRFMHALSGNSRAILEQLAAEGAPESRLHLIHNGIDLSHYDATVPQPAPELALLIVANLIPYKGHVDLIDALAIASPALPPWRLRCAGRDDGIGAALASRAREAGIADRIDFLGSRADVPALLAQADIAILASHEEGFPNAAIEAMAAARPIVATEVGGVPEAVVDGETGLLAPARDPARLAAALVRLGTDPALRRKMGAEARARAERLFGLDACVERYLALYRALSGPAPLPGPEHQHDP